jgi:DNA-binding response OmpR family regulator
MASSNKALKILVVEDTPGDVFLIKFYLEEIDPDNYEIKSVDNLTEAHQMMSRENFDVILLDLHLPDSQGLMTVKHSVEKFPNDVFIVLTGLSDERIGLEAVKNGAQDFLVKGRIDSKSLDSSIKFSFQRAKLKRAVKIYGEALITLESMYQMVIVLIDNARNAVYTSPQFQSFFGLQQETVDTKEELLEVFGHNPVFVEAIANAQQKEVMDLNMIYRGETLRFKISKPAADVDQTVISIAR